jgi:hypothetical protein
MLKVLTLISIVKIVHGATYPCPSPSFVDPVASIASPIFPATELTEYPTATLPIIQDHWSEEAKMFRPPKIVPVAFPSVSGCPHSQSGLKNFHDPAAWPGTKN